MRRIAAAIVPIALGLVVYGCQSGQTDANTPQVPQDPKPGTSGTATSEPSEMMVAFADVDALMESKCVMCHGTQPKEGVDLRTHESIMKGGEHGAIVVPGKPEESLIIKMVKGAEGHDRMPPQGEPLNAEQIAMIEAWIRQGAKSS